MTSKTFINPFHFVPPTEAVEPSTVSDIQQTLASKPARDKKHVPSVPQLLHDRYLATGATPTGPEHYSGRIVCRLTTKMACVFGNEHHKVKLPQEQDGRRTLEDATRVDNFVLAGHAGIAGTSLKGMLSTIAEMASGSAMRVLNNRALSLRSSMKQSRSAVGMIVVHKGRRMLLPLALPTFSMPDGTLEPTDGSKNKIWHEILRRRQSIDPAATLTAIYVKKDTPAEFCFHPHRTVVALPGSFPGIAWDKPSERPKEIQHQDVTIRKNALLRPIKNDGEAYEVVPADPAGDQTWGIVRRLQKPAVSPPRLWFSLFLPICRQWRNDEGRFELPEEHKDVLLLDADEACREFDTIVTDKFSNAPDAPSCTALQNQDDFSRPTKPGQRLTNPGLREGDLVFFRPLSPTAVESVAIASIWRERVRWIWRRDTEDEKQPWLDQRTLLDTTEQRPMNRGRETVTMAEKLFGWVEVRGDSKGTSDKKDEGDFVAAYKGRVRVSDAISELALHQSLVEPNRDTWADPEYEEVKGYYPLRILASPKPPCPEMYMRYRNSSADATALRKDLAQSAAGDIAIQGWKFYVLDAAAVDRDAPARWMTRHAKAHVQQKTWVRPIKCGTAFWFHVDFENLTARELQLLCYALRPEKDFVHRCGFGKPLQMGGVKIEPLALAFIDRRQRYCAARGLLSRRQRFDRVVLEDREALAQLGNDGQSVVFSERGYHRLLDVSNSPEASGAPASFAALSVGGLAEQFAKEIKKHHHVMQLVGRPVNVPADCCGVTYPRLRSQDGEEDIYRWFVANREHDATLLQPPLAPLTNESNSIPTLNLGISVAVDPLIERQSRNAITRRLRALAQSWQLPMEILEPKPSKRQACVAESSIDFFIGFNEFPVRKPRFAAEPAMRVSAHELEAWLNETLG